MADEQMKAGASSSHSTAGTGLAAMVKNIAALVERVGQIAAKTEQARSDIKNLRDVYAALNREVQSLAGQFGGMSKAAEQTAASTGKLADAMKYVRKGSQQTTAAVKETAAAQERSVRHVRNVRMEYEHTLQSIERIKRTLRTTTFGPGGIDVVRKRFGGKMNEPLKQLWQDTRAMGVRYKSLDVQEAAIRLSPEASSLGNRLRLVNVQLEKYAVLARAGYTADSQYAQSLGFTAERVNKLRVEQQQLNKQLGEQGIHGSGGPKRGWASSAMQQAQYWGRLKLMMMGYQKAQQGLQTFADLEGGVNRAVRTAVQDTTDWNEVTTARIRIQNAANQYLSKHVGTVDEYTTTINELTSAEMRLSEAIKSAPTMLAMSKGLDASVQDTTRLMLGLNEIFRDAFKGVETDSERMARMGSIVSMAVKKEVVSVNDLVKGLSYSANIAKVANMSFSELVAGTAMLNTQLIRGSQAGTGMRQMLNALAKNADKLNEQFNLGVDKRKPFAFAQTLEALGKQLENGKLSVGRIEQFLGGFQLRGAPAVLSLAQSFQAFARTVRQLEAAKLDDLLGMRDIMEKNVPAQLKILSGNVDLLVANFLRGAVGGNNMAASLENINAGMAPMHATMKSLGDVIGIVTKKEVLLGLAAAGVAVQMRKAITAMKAFQLASVGNWATAALLALGSVLYLYNRHQQAVEDNIAESEKQASQHRQEAVRLESLGDAVVVLAQNEEELGRVKEELRKKAAELGMQFDENIKTVDEYRTAIRALADEEKKREQRALQSKALQLAQKGTPGMFSFGQPNRQGDAVDTTGYAAGDMGQFFGTQPPSLWQSTKNRWAARSIPSATKLNEAIETAREYADAARRSGMFTEDEMRSTTQGMLGNWDTFIRTLLRDAEAVMNDTTGKYTAEERRVIARHIEQLRSYERTVTELLVSPWQAAVNATDKSLKAQRSLLEQQAKLLSASQSRAVWKMMGAPLVGAAGTAVKTPGGDRMLSGADYQRSLAYSESRQAAIMALAAKADDRYRMKEIADAVMRQFDEKTAARMMRALAAGPEAVYGRRMAAASGPEAEVLRAELDQLLAVVRGIQPDLLNENGAFKRGGFIGLMNQLAGGQLKPEIVQRMVDGLSETQTDTEKLIAEYQKANVELEQVNTKLDETNKQLETLNKSLTPAAKPSAPAMAASTLGGNWPVPLIPTVQDRLASQADLGQAWKNMVIPPGSLYSPSVLPGRGGDSNVASDAALGAMMNNRVMNVTVNIDEKQFAQFVQKTADAVSITIPLASEAVKKADAVLEGARATSNELRRLGGK